MARDNLLLMVQMDCAADELEPFNQWYNSHLPNLLRVPGFQWASRYTGITELNRFTALYGLRSEDDLPSTLGRHTSSFHPIARSELDGHQQLKGLSNRSLSVYEQIAGTPITDSLLSGDYPVSIVTADVDPKEEDDWNRWYNESHFPNVLAVPGYVLGGRFRAIDHPALAGVSTGPRYMALYEVESEEVIPSLGDESQMRTEARDEIANWKRNGLPRASNVSWGFYKMISKHFKWMDG